MYTLQLLRKHIHITDKAIRWLQKFTIQQYKEDVVLISSLVDVLSQNTLEKIFPKSSCLNDFKIICKSDDLLHLVNTAHPCVFIFNVH